KIHTLEAQNAQGTRKDNGARREIKEFNRVLQHAGARLPLANGLRTTSACETAHTSCMCSFASCGADTSAQLLPEATEQLSCLIIEHVDSVPHLILRGCDRP